MPRPIVKRFAISTAEQLRALRSPTRHQILAAMERRGPCSVRDLAADTGRPAESLYYHVKALLRIGLVVEKQRRSTGRREEVVYELVSRQITVDPRKRSPTFLKELSKVYSSALRAADRNLSRALELEAAMGPGPRTAASVRQWTVRLDTGSARELRRLFEELDAFVNEHDDPAAGTAYSLTVALSLFPPASRGPHR